MLGSSAAGAQGSSTPQGVETARRTWLLAAARENRGRGFAVAGASSPDPHSHRRVGWKGSRDARARGMLWPCGSLRPREAYRHWRWRTEAVTPELQAVTESRIGPRSSVLPPGDGERPRGPGGGSGTVLRRTQAASSVCAAGISATPAGDPTGTGEDGRGG